MSETNEIKGIGGWLILLGFYITISPFIILVQALIIYWDIFSNEYWKALITPGNDMYNPFWAPLVIVEMIIDSGLVFAWIYLIFLFFEKNKKFPKWFVNILLFNLVFILIDGLIASIVFPKKLIFGHEMYKEIIRAIFQIIIWVPYIYASKRVKVTFVN